MWLARWTTLCAKRLGAAELNGKIYLFGGFIGGGTHVDGQPSAFEYDPSLNTWRLLAPMKAGRGSPGAAAADGTICVIGGRDPTGKTVNTNSAYDPATNTWKDDLAPLPQARDHLAIGLIDGKVHLVGGRFGAATDPTNEHDIYDPKTNTWTSGPPMPTKRSGLAGTVYKGLFLVLGGEVPTEHRTNTENEAFNPKTNSWRTLAPMPMGRHGTNAATDGEHVYLVGGSHLAGGGRRDQRADRVHTAVRPDKQLRFRRVRHAFPVGWLVCSATDVKPSPR
jgi:N-acetylneuraminic acid mutarotase